MPGHCMVQIDALPPLRDVIRAHDLSANKAFGQNFLLDLNLTSRIARTAGDLSQHTVLEIGPGPGGLTRALLAEDARKVIALEKDARFGPALAEIESHYPGRLQVHRLDALTADHRLLVNGPTKVVANLPYNIATALLINWLQAGMSEIWWDSLTLLFQKEVAQRVVAAPGTEHYGRLSVVCAVFSISRIAFDVPRQAFTPQPKVTSSLLHIVPRPEADFTLMKALETVTRAAFGQRRKMLRSSLKSVFPDPEKALEPLGIDPTQRAETVTIEGFLDLARVHKSRSGNS